MLRQFFCVYAVRFLCNYDVFMLSANSLLTDELSAEAMFSVADKLFKKLALRSRSVRRCARTSPC